MGEEFVSEAAGGEAGHAGGADHAPLAVAPIHKAAGETVEGGVEEEIARVGGPEHGLAGAEFELGPLLVDVVIKAFEFVRLADVGIDVGDGEPLALKAGL